MMYELPTTLEIDGVEYAIRSDYRAALDIIAALSDNDYSEVEKSVALIYILYENPEDINNYEKAIKSALWFLSCGSDEASKKQIKLVDWEQDFQYVAAEVNKQCGKEVRSVDYMHWWTFVGYYLCIGEGILSNIVNIRNKKAKGKKLEPWEKEFYANNRNIIDFKKDSNLSERQKFGKWMEEQLWPQKTESL